MPLEIEKREEGGITVLKLSGDLDTGTAGQLETEVKGIISTADPKIIFDMAGIKYVSSFGLRVIVYTSKAMRAHGDRFSLHSAQQDVMGILKLSGLEKFLKVAEDHQSAIELLES